MAPGWCSIVHSGDSAPNSVARTPSKALCSRIVASDSAAITRIGRWISAARMIIEPPSANSVSSSTGNDGSKLRSNATRITTISTTISHRPRVQRKRESWALVRPGRASQRRALVPASSTNTGAQRCVIHRVKKSSGVVVVRSVGCCDIAATWKKSRVWSSAMMIMTSPRSVSTACRRREVSRVIAGQDRQQGPRSPTSRRC